MNLQQVVAALTNGTTVYLEGRPVTVVKASVQMVYVTHGGPANDRVRVTPDQLSETA